MTQPANFRAPLRIALTILLTTLFALPHANADQLTQGTSSSQIKSQAIRAIPFDRINNQGRTKISDVVNKPSVYRRLPVTSINCDADYYKFLVRYPEVIVNIWQLMGVTKMTTDRTGPYSIATNDGAGTISELELVYGTDNLHVFYGTGTYEGPVLKRKLKGKCVLVLHSKGGKDTTGKSAVTSQLDVFLKIDNATAGLIAKSITPIVGSTADHNFVESLKFVERLNETTEKNGPGVQKMGSRLDISSEVRSQFNEVVDLVFERSINSGPSTNRRAEANGSVTRAAYAPASNSQSMSQGQVQPAANQTGYGAPVYNTFNDGRQVQPSDYRSNQRAFPPSAGQRTDTSQYLPPARGSQAPTYPPSYAAGQPQYQQQFYNTQESQRLQHVQPASWRQR